ncbi:hypothetical protein PND37_05660 [Lactiplantibacillus plantarum]|uniref:hypothetical protein n=1 Tax=Lactiplantibacillus plantarum TaxID=1590 RepID=UPI0018975FD5|nr:hypothetical protein [Lactiplantibacillus plantarum]MDB7774398.1 hypothetical protein [Lactiplantibacillus plantarum]
MEKLTQKPLSLDEAEQWIEQINQEIGAIKMVIEEPKQLVKQLTSLLKDDELKIEQMHDFERMAMRDREVVETDYYKFTMGQVNPASSRNWDLIRDKVATPKQVTALYEKFDQSLLKTTKSVNETEIKQRLADGSLVVTPKGEIVNADGEVLPAYSGALKPTKVNVKAKE